MNSASSPALEITELGKRYGDVEALSDFSLTLSPGEVVALLGPNGSGKTTTIRCAAGLLRPTAGNVRISGIDMRRQPRQARRALAYLPQQARFPIHLTAREVVAFHAGLRRLPRETEETALTEAGLAGDAVMRRIGSLSGGMRQRLALAVACLAPVPLMLLDEPTANLDPGGALQFRDLAQRWRREGRALLLSTHVLSDAVELADRVVILVGGRPVAEEALPALRARLSRAARLRVDVGSPGEAHRVAALAAGASDVRLNHSSLIVTAPQDRRLPVLERLAALGPVRHFETEKPAVEDIYLDYVRGDRHGLP